jgi:hypothetical protein
MRTLSATLTALLLASLAPAQRQGGGPIRPGPWQTAAKVPPGWVVHNTKNYHVQSEAGIEKAKRLGEHMEVMNEIYRRMFRTDKGGAKQQTIKLFKDEKTYKGYGAPQGAAAYYSSGEREMVCYDTGKWMDEGTPAGPITGADTAESRLARRLKLMDDAWKMDLLGCAAHEGWHQYFHWFVGSEVSLPSWINEGMGDYFYTAAPKEKKGAKRTPVALGNTFDGRLMIIKEAKRQDRMVPLAEFLGMHQREYYSNPSVCYAQGWALCQFLLHGAEGKYAKVVPNYIMLVKDDTNTEVVQARAFKGIDVALLETEFKAWLDTQKPSAAALAEAEADAQEQGQGEAENPPAPEPEPVPPGKGREGGG